MKLYYNFRIMNDTTARCTIDIPDGLKDVFHLHDHNRTTTLHMIWRYQIAWGQICFILGIVGNVYVLFATIAHQAIKLDEMSIWIIQNLAVVDICNCVLVLLPILVTQYGKLHQTVIFGRKFYVFMGCYRYTFLVANFWLVNMLSLNKLVRCLYPLRHLDSTRRQRMAGTVFTILSTTVPTLWIAYGLVDDFLVTSPAWSCETYIGAREINAVHVVLRKIGYTRKMINYTIVGISSALPGITLVTINVTLLFFARMRAKSAINKRNLLTVICVTVAFLMSVLPVFFTYMPVSLPPECYEIFYSIAFLSAWINPIIYLAVNPQFGEFTRVKIQHCKRRAVRMKMMRKVGGEPYHRQMETDV